MRTSVRMSLQGQTLPSDGHSANDRFRGERKSVGKGHVLPLSAGSSPFPAIASSGHPAAWHRARSAPRSAAVAGTV